MFFIYLPLFLCAESNIYFDKNENLDSERTKQEKLIYYSENSNCLESFSEFTYLIPLYKKNLDIFFRNIMQLIEKAENVIIISNSPEKKHNIAKIIKVAQDKLSHIRLVSLTKNYDMTIAIRKLFLVFEFTLITFSDIMRYHLENTISCNLYNICVMKKRFEKFKNVLDNMQESVKSLEKNIQEYGTPTMFDVFNLKWYLKHNMKFLNPNNIWVDNVYSLSIEFYMSKFSKNLHSTESFTDLTNIFKDATKDINFMNKNIFQRSLSIYLLHELYLSVMCETFFYEYQNLSQCSPGYAIFLTYLSSNALINYVLES